METPAIADVSADIEDRCAKEVQDILAPLMGDADAPVKSEHSREEMERAICELIRQDTRARLLDMLAASEQERMSLGGAVWPQHDTTGTPGPSIGRATQMLERELGACAQQLQEEARLCAAAAQEYLQSVRQLEELHNTLSRNDSKSGAASVAVQTDPTTATTAKSSKQW